MAKIEFYVGTAMKHIAVLDDGAVPREGEFISIQKTTWRVRRVTWAVDGDVSVFRAATLRANVELEKLSSEEEHPWESVILVSSCRATSAQRKRLTA